MRFVIDIDAVADGIRGRLRRENDDIGAPFRGWLQLMALLEASEHTPPPDNQPEQEPS